MQALSLHAARLHNQKWLVKLHFPEVTSMLRQTRVLLIGLMILVALVPGYRALSASDAEIWSPGQSTAPPSQQHHHIGEEELQSSPFSLEDDTPYMAGRLLVQFAPGTSEEEKAEIHTRLGAEVVDAIPALGIQILQVPEEATSMVFAYQAEPAVTFAEPDYIAKIAGWPDGPVLSATALTTVGEGLTMQPDDPLYPDMWNLAKIQADRGWDITVGSSSVTIAVIDTGADASHPDLQGKLIAGRDFVNNDDDPADDQGHGTHVAGTAAAATNNNVGIAGMAWDVKVMPVKALSSAGAGAHSWIANGIVWATDNGADVINMSLGGPYTSATMQQAVNYAWEQGSVVIAAAGNGRTSNPTYPAAYENAMGVSASTQSDERASFSNYGNYVSVASPGVSIMSTTRGGNYQAWSGTSMATPHVAGLAALIKSIHPDWTNAQIRETLEETAIDLGTPGWDPIFGWGRIDAYEALNSDAPDPAPTATATATPTPRSPTAVPGDLEQQLIDAINAERTALGLSPLQRDERLMEAARRHSSDMAANMQQCTHNGSDGSDPFRRIRDTGYPMASGSEVIACGYQTPSDALRGWKQSPGHWAILTNENFVHIGCGVDEAFDGTRYWTCNPARPTDTGDPTPVPTGTPTSTGVPATPTSTDIPATPTATPSPTPTRTPSPIPTDPVNQETVYITPQPQYAGWVVSNEASGNHFKDDDIYAGVHGGQAYLGAFQFDLSEIPSNAQFNWGRLTLTGQTRDFVGDHGSWSIALLTSDVDDDWVNHGYVQIRDATEEHLLLPILGNADLQRDKENVFNLDSPVLRSLEYMRRGTGHASFRAEGPTNGSNNLFSWDTGYGTGGLLKPPILTINYTLREDGEEPPPPTPTPNPTSDPGDASVIELTPPPDNVGWVGSHEAGNNFRDDDLYAGMFTANTYLSGIRFDLSPLPASVEVLEAELRLTGQTRQYLGSTGTWQVEMLSEAMDAGWVQHNFNDINNASAIGTLMDLEEGDFGLGPDQLDVEKVNRLGLIEALRAELGRRRQNTGYVSFRVGGPRTGDNNVFSWDTGYGSGGLLEPPVLYVKYRQAGGGPGPSPTPRPSATPTLPPDNSDTDALISTINDERANRGLPSLVVDNSLKQAAEVHSHDLATNNLWSHTGSDSSSPQDRMRRAGYPLDAGDEALAANSTDLNAILNAWLANSKHEKMLMSPDYVDIGVGHAYNARSTYGDYWTVLVARPRDGGDDTSPIETAVQITPRETAVGWVASDEPDANYFGDDDVYAGFYNGLIHLGAVQFDLSSVPAEAQITGATLKLTGQTVVYLTGNGSWEVHMLASDADAGWPSHGYSAIANASSVGIVGEPLEASDLGANQDNVLTFSDTLLEEIDRRVHGNGFASFRIDGPKSGSNDVFAWDSGYGIDGLGKPPILTISYTLP